MIHFKKENSAQTYIIKYFAEDSKIHSIQVTGRGVSMAKKEFERLTKLDRKAIFKIINYNEIKK